MAGERADVAEAEHAGAVGEDADGVADGGVLPGLLRVPLDGERDAGDAGRVDGAEVAELLQLDAARGVELAAAVGGEDAVGDGDELEPVHGAHGVDDPLGLGFGAGLHRHLAHGVFFADAQGR